MGNYDLRSSVSVADYSKLWGPSSRLQVLCAKGEVMAFLVLCAGVFGFFAGFSLAMYLWARDVEIKRKTQRYIAKHIDPYNKYF